MSRKAHILLGAAGSGKGTQAKRLVETFHLTHLSTGDILRDAVSRGTEIGLRAKAIMAEGKLVDDDTVNGLVFARLQEETGDVLFDGYPRTLQQAQALDAFLSSNGWTLGEVVFLEVPREVLEARVVGRRLCSSNACGAIYHMSTKPPKVENVCDVCGSPLKHRQDDTPEAFGARWMDFEATTLKVVDFFKDRAGFRALNGDQAPDTVFQTLSQIFGVTA